MLTSVLGAPVRSPEGRDLGRVRDVLIDLAGGLDRVPVTGVVVEGWGQPARVVPWQVADGRGGQLSMVSPERTCDAAVGRVPLTTSTEVLVGRDILDSPVVLADPSRRARVSDVVLELEEGQAWVTGLDLSTAGAFRRLLGPSGAPHGVEPVPLSKVHLLAAPAHAAQLAVPGAMVFGLHPGGMAEVLTRVPVAHARDILRVVDEEVSVRALPLLHPHVRSRLTDAGPAPRRARRLAGWLLHRPTRPDVGGPGGRDPAGPRRQGEP